MNVTDKAGSRCTRGCLQAVTGVGRALEREESRFCLARSSGVDVVEEKDGKDPNLTFYVL